MLFVACSSALRPLVGTRFLCILRYAWKEMLKCAVYCCLEGLDVSYESGCLVQTSEDSCMQLSLVLDPYAFSEKGKSYRNDVQCR